MSCSLDIQIKNGIIEKASDMLISSGAFSVEGNIAKVIDENLDYGKAIMDINDSFKEQVVKKLTKEQIENNRKAEIESFVTNIFPDTQVKEIVYHGTNKKFDKFDKSFINKSFEDLIFFFKNRKNAEEWSEKSELNVKKEDLIENIINLNTSMQEANIEDNILYGLTQHFTLKSKEELIEKNNDSFNKITSLLDYLNLDINTLYNLSNSDIEKYRTLVRDSINNSPIEKVINNNRVISSIINSENPLILKESYDYYLGKESGKKFTRDVKNNIEKYDSLVAEDVTEYENDEIKNRDTQYAVKEPEQIHILTEEEIKQIDEINKKYDNLQEGLYSINPSDALINKYLEVAPVEENERDKIKKEAIENGNWMKSPNGNPSNLTEYQWITVRTKSFKSWFGDWENDPNNSSKILDKNGEPLVVYHGTKTGNKNIDIFEKRGDLSGFYFSDSRVASNYANTEIKREAQYILENEGFDLYGSIVSVFLNIKNPVFWERIYGDIRSKNPYSFEIDPNNIQDKDISILKSNNYDGVYYDNGYLQIVAINPNQIKSAISNIGNFNNSNNILYQSNNKKQLQPAIEELDKYLLNFLKQFGVQSKQFEELKSRLGVDALGATDVLNKLIWYVQNRNEETVPEEVGHMIVMLMGENHPIIKELMNNIHLWNEYLSIREEYLPIYNNGKQVQIEAIGKLIAKSLVKGYKANGFKSMSFIDKIIRYIKSIFTINSSFYLADKIAANILSGNIDFIANLKPTTDILNYQEALNNNKFAQKIIEDFGKGTNSVLTGSLAVAGQNEIIYRDSKEPIHDLDFIVKNENVEKINNKLKQYNIIPVHTGWANKTKGYKTEAYWITNKENTIEPNVVENGWVKSVIIKDKDGNILESNSTNVISVDFFVYDKDVNISKITVGEFASWQDIYDGKLGLSPMGANERMFQRDKDQTDYILSNPTSRNFLSNPNFVYYQLPQPQIKEGVEELFDSNPELANQVYEALGFNNLIKPTDKIIWGHPAIGKTTMLESNPDAFIDWDNEFNRQRDSWIADKSNTTLGSPEFKQARNEYMINYDNHKDYIKFVTDEWNKAKEKATNEGKQLIASPHMLLNLFPNDFDKIVNLDDKTFLDRAIKRSNGDETNSKLWKEGINKTLKKVDKNKLITTDKFIGDLFVTPQQKQQALQAYSQYLDTIFTDSKVKDIVYHGADEKISFFDFTKKKNKNEKGLFFFGKRKSAQLWRDASFEEDNTQKGDLISALINLKNPRLENFENKSAWDMQQYTSANNSTLTKNGKSLLDTTFNKVENNKSIVYANYLADGENALKNILNTIAKLHIYENYRSQNRVNQLEKKDSSKKQLEKEIEQGLKEGLSIKEIYDKKIQSIKDKIKDLIETLNLLSKNKTSQAYLFASMLLNNNVEKETLDIINHYKSLLKTLQQGGLELFEQLAEKNYSIYGNTSEDIVDLLEQEKLSDFSKYYKGLLRKQIKEIKENFFIGELTRKGNPTDNNIFDKLTDNFIEDFINEGNESLTVQFLKDLSNETSINAKTKNLVRELERRLDILKNKKNEHYLMTILNLKQYNEKVKDVPTNLKENQDGLIATNVDEMWVGRDTQYAVFEPEQIHILGNKEDVEGFKEFVKGEKVLASEPELTNQVDNKRIGLSKEIKDKYFPDGELTDSSRILSVIAQNNSWLSPLAKKLLQYNMSIPVIAEDRGAYENISSNAKLSSAYYSSSFHQISIATQAENDLRLEETLVHEILHGFSVNFIRNNPNDNIVKDLNKILEYLQSKTKDKYYLSNIEEMVVGFFTNPEFITKLKNTPAKGLASEYKNVWEQIFDYIARAFNFSTRDLNLYNELYPLMTNVIDEGYKYYEKRDLFYDYQENFDDTLFGNEFIQPIKYNSGNEIKTFPAFRDNLPINIKRGLEGKFTTSEVAQMSLTKLSQRLQKLFPQIVIKEISPTQLNQKDHTEDINTIKGFIKDNTVFLVEGRFDEETVVEEFLHPVVLGMSTVNEELFNNLLKESLKTYSKEHKKISKNRNKEEADLEVVTKALRDKVIENSNPSLYQQFIDFLKSVYKRLFFKSNPDISPSSTLEDIAKFLLKGGHNFKTQFTDTIFYNTDGQKWVDEIRNKIINHPKNNNIVKIGKDEGYTMNGKKISRVTTLVDMIHKEFFKNKKQNEKNQAEAEIAAEEGTKGHNAIEHIIDRYVDPTTGKFRENVLPYEEFTEVPKKVYEELELFIENILNLYKPIEGVVILREQLLANVKGRSAVAGTSDFIAILPNKEIHILDWKFIINRDGKTVHPEWKKKGWDKQLIEYKAAIQQAIGATDQEMNKYTKKARIVPFLTNYTKDGIKINNEDVRDSKIHSIQAPYLTPKINVSRARYQYVTEAEIGTKNKVSNLVNKIKQISATEQKLKQSETEKKVGIDYVLNQAINDAIQDFFLFGNMEEILKIHEDTLEDIKTYLEVLNSKPISELISDVNWNRTQDYILSLSELSQSITGLYPVAEIVFGEGLEKSVLNEEEIKKPENVEKENLLKERIKNIKFQSENYIRKVFEKNEEIQDASAKSEGIVGLLSEEMQVRGWSKKLFTTNKSGQTRAVLLLTKLLEKIEPKITLRINEGKLKIKKLKDNIEKNGVRKSKDLIDFLVNKNLGKLNSKYTEEFWKEYNDIKESGNKQKAKEFAEKYYNVNKAREVFNKEMEIKLQELESIASHQSEQQKEKSAEYIRNYWDLNSDSAEPWIRIVKQIENYLIEDDKFMNQYSSSFYKDLKRDKYALDFYNYIISINKRLAELGFISYSDQYRFIPFIPKGFTEANLKDYWKTAKLKVQIRSGEEYGEIDSITGELKKGFAMPFVEDIFGKDKTNMSFDLFSNYSTLLESLESIEAKQKLEPFALNILEIEKNKKVIPVGVTGKPLKEAGTNNTLDSITSSVNAEYYEDFIDALIYGIRIKESSDKRFKIEKTKEIQDPDDPNKTITVPDRTEYYSVAKMLQEALNIIYLNTFGLNVFTPLRQYIASPFQAYFANNKHYTSEDLAKNERFISRLSKGLRSSDKRDLLFEYVMPFLNPEFQQKTNAVSVNGVRRWMNMENMMYLMRASSGSTQAIIANSILDNIVVIEGVAHHVREYIDNKYADIYEKNPEERKALEKKIDNEIKELKKNNRLDNYITIKEVNGEKNIEIEGISNKDDILNKFRSLTQYYSKQVTGEGSRDEIMLSQRYTVSRLFMMYRSWIPRTVKARIGSFEYNTDLNNYEWGRWGAYSSIVNQAGKESLLKAAKYALGIGMKEEMIKYAQEKYNQLEKKMREENRLVTGSMMSEKEFIDMFLNNYSKTHKEFKFIIAMMGILATPFMTAGEGDDDRTKAVKAFIRFHFDRMQDEFSFYVNPKSFIDILGNSVPATTYAKRWMTVLANPFQEVYYNMIGEEKKAQNNQVIRDILNVLPVTSQITKLIPIINPDLANEFGIKPVKIIN